MAERKQHNFVAAGGTTPSGKKAQQARPVGNAGGLRAGAVILWVLALAMEVCAFLVLGGKLDLKFAPVLYQLIGFLVLDLIFVIVAAQLWKKANHIRPASERNKAAFWLWNNLGVIMAIVCFVPMIILLFTNKDLDKKTKTIAIVAAVIALLIGGAASIDYNPVSQEQLGAAVSALGDETVYWAPFGKVYHTHDDCQALNRTETLTYGTVEEAIAAGKTRLCSFCASRDDIRDVVTDGE